MTNSNHELIATINPTTLSKKLNTSFNSKTTNSSSKQYDSIINEIGASNEVDPKSIESLRNFLELESSSHLETYTKNTKDKIKRQIFDCLEMGLVVYTAYQNINTILRDCDNQIKDYVARGEQKGIELSQFINQIKANFADHYNKGLTDLSNWLMTEWPLYLHQLKCKEELVAVNFSQKSESYILYQDDATDLNQRLIDYVYQNAVSDWGNIYVNANGLTPNIADQIDYYANAYVKKVIDNVFAQSRASVADIKNNLRDIERIAFNANKDELVDDLIKDNDQDFSVLNKCQRMSDDEVEQLYQKINEVKNEEIKSALLNTIETFHLDPSVKNVYKKDREKSFKELYGSDTHKLTFKNLSLYLSQLTPVSEAQLVLKDELAKWLNNLIANRDKYEPDSLILDKQCALYLVQSLYRAKENLLDDNLTKDLESMLTDSKVTELGDLELASICAQFIERIKHSNLLQLTKNPVKNNFNLSSTKPDISADRYLQLYALTTSNFNDNQNNDFLADLYQGFSYLLTAANLGNAYAHKILGSKHILSVDINKKIDELFYERLKTYQLESKIYREAQFKLALSYYKKRYEQIYVNYEDRFQDLLLMLSALQQAGDLQPALCDTLQIDFSKPLTKEDLELNAYRLLVLELAGHDPLQKIFPNHASHYPFQHSEDKLKAMLDNAFGNDKDSQKHIDDFVKQHHKQFALGYRNTTIREGGAYTLPIKAYQLDSLTTSLSFVDPTTHEEIGRFSNEGGVIHFVGFKSGIKLDFEDDLTNDKFIFDNIDGDLTINGNIKTDNDLAIIVHARKLQVNGEVTSKASINLESDADINLAKSASISCDKYLNLVAQSANCAGTLSARSINLDLDKTLSTDAESSIKANDELIITATALKDIRGEIIANSAMHVHCSDGVYLNGKSSLYARDQLYLRAKSLFATDKSTVKSDQVFVSAVDQIMIAKDSEWAAKNISLSGNIITNDSRNINCDAGSIYAKHQFTNSDHGILNTKEYLRLLGANVCNNGEINFGEHLDVNVDNLFLNGLGSDQTLSNLLINIKADNLLDPAQETMPIKSFINGKDINITASSYVNLLGRLEVRDFALKSETALNAGEELTSDSSKICVINSNPGKSSPNLKECGAAIKNYLRLVSNHEFAKTLDRFKDSLKCENDNYAADLAKKILPVTQQNAVTDYQEGTLVSGNIRSNSLYRYTELNTESAVNILKQFKEAKEEQALTFADTETVIGEKFEHSGNDYAKHNYSQVDERTEKGQINAEVLSWKGNTLKTIEKSVLNAKKIIIDEINAIFNGNNKANTMKINADYLHLAKTSKTEIEDLLSMQARNIALDGEVDTYQIHSYSTESTTLNGPIKAQQSDISSDDKLRFNNQFDKRSSAENEESPSFVAKAKEVAYSKGSHLNWSGTVLTQGEIIKEEGTKEVTNEINRADKQHEMSGTTKADTVSNTSQTEVIKGKYTVKDVFVVNTDELKLEKSSHVDVEGNTIFDIINGVIEGEHQLNTAELTAEEKILNKSKLKFHKAKINAKDFNNAGEMKMVSQQDAPAELNVKAETFEQEKTLEGTNAHVAIEANQSAKFTPGSTTNVDSISAKSPITSFEGESNTKDINVDAALYVIFDGKTKVSHAYIKSNQMLAKGEMDFANDNDLSSLLAEVNSFQQDAASNIHNADKTSIHAKDEANFAGNMDGEFFDIKSDNVKFMGSLAFKDLQVKCKEIQNLGKLATEQLGVDAEAYAEFDGSTKALNIFVKSKAIKLKGDMSAAEVNAQGETLEQSKESVLSTKITSFDIEKLKAEGAMTSEEMKVKGRIIRCLGTLNTNKLDVDAKIYAEFDGQTKAVNIFVKSEKTKLSGEMAANVAEVKGDSLEQAETSVLKAAHINLAMEGLIETKGTTVSQTMQEKGKEIRHLGKLTTEKLGVDAEAYAEFDGSTKALNIFVKSKAIKLKGDMSAVEVKAQGATLEQTQESILSTKITTLDIEQLKTEGVITSEEMKVKGKIIKCLGTLNTNKLDVDAKLYAEFDGATKAVNIFVKSEKTKLSGEMAANVAEVKGDSLEQTEESVLKAAHINFDMEGLIETKGTTVSQTIREKGKEIRNLGKLATEKLGVDAEAYAEFDGKTKALNIFVKSKSIKLNGDMSAAELEARGKTLEQTQESVLSTNISSFEIEQLKLAGETNSGEVKTNGKIIKCLGTLNTNKLDVDAKLYAEFEGTTKAVNIFVKSEKTKLSGEMTAKVAEFKGDSLEQTEESVLKAKHINFDMEGLIETKGTTVSQTMQEKGKEIRHLGKLDTEKLGVDAEAYAEFDGSTKALNIFVKSKSIKLKGDMSAAELKAQGETLEQTQQTVLSANITSFDIEQLVLAGTTNSGEVKTNGKIIKCLGILNTNKLDVDAKLYAEFDGTTKAINIFVKSDLTNLAGQIEANKGEFKGDILTQTENSVLKIGNLDIDMQGLVETKGDVISNETHLKGDIVTSLGKLNTNNLNIDAEVYAQLDGDTKALKVFVKGKRISQNGRTEAQDFKTEGDVLVQGSAGEIISKTSSFDMREVAELAGKNASDKLEASGKIVKCLGSIDTKDLDIKADLYAEIDGNTKAINLYVQTKSLTTKGEIVSEKTEVKAEDTQFLGKLDTKSLGVDASLFVKFNGETKALNVHVKTKEFQNNSKITLKKDIEHPETEAIFNVEADNIEQTEKASIDGDGNDTVAMEAKQQALLHGLFNIKNILVSGDKVILKAKVDANLLSAHAKEQLTTTGILNVETSILKSDKRADIAGEHHVGSEVIDAPEVKDDALIDFKKSLGIKSDNLTMSQQSQTTGEGTLKIDSHTAQLRNINVKELDLSQDHIAQIEDLLNQHGMYRDVRARENMQLHTKDKVTLAEAMSLPYSVAIMAPAIDVNGEMNGDKNIELVATEGDVRTNNKLFAKQMLFIDAHNNFYNDFGKASGGDGLCIHVGENVVNHAGILSSPKYVKILADHGNVINQAIQYTVPGEYGPMQQYVPAYIYGGTGEDNQGYGLFMKLGGKFINDASVVHSIGSNYIEADKGIESLARYNQFISYHKEWHNFWKDKETTEYDYQKQPASIYSVNGKNTLISKDGGIYFLSTDMFGKDGNVLGTKGDIDLRGLVLEKKCVKDASAGFGLLQDHSREMHQLNVPTIVADYKDTSIVSLNNVNILNALMIGPGDLAIKGKNITVSAPKLNHSFEEESWGFDCSLPYLDQISGYSLFKDLKGLKEGNAIEKLANAWNTGVDGLNTFNNLANAQKGNISALCTPTVEVNYGRTHQKQKYQTIADNVGIQRGGSFYVTADDTAAFLEGVQVLIDGDGFINAKRLVQQGAELESSSEQDSEKVTVGLSAGSKPAVGGRASYSQSNATTHFNQLFHFGGTFETNVDEWIMQAANTEAANWRGKIGKLSIITPLDTSNSESASVEANTGGTVGASYSKNKSAHVGKASGVRIKNSINTSDDNHVHIGELDSQGGEIISDAVNNVEINRVNAQDQQEYEDGSGFGFTANAFAKNPNGCQEAIPNVPVQLGYDHKRGVQHTTIYGAQGSNPKIGSQTGNVNTASADGHEVKEDQHFHATLKVPTSLDGPGMQQAKDNLKRFEDFLISSDTAAPSERPPVEKPQITKEDRKKKEKPKPENDEEEAKTKEKAAGKSAKTKTVTEKKVTNGPKKETKSENQEHVNEYDPVYDQNLTCLDPAFYHKPAFLDKKQYFKSKNPNDDTLPNIQDDKTKVDTRSSPQEISNKVANTQPMFEPIPMPTFMEVADQTFADGVGWLYKHPRTAGTLQAVGGLGQTAGGVFGGIVSCPTVVGPVFFGGVMTSGIDNTWTGLKQLWTGEHQQTGFVKIVESFGGNGLYAGLGQTIFDIGSLPTISVAKFASQPAKVVTATTALKEVPKNTPVKGMETKDIYKGLGIDTKQAVENSLEAKLQPSTSTKANGGTGSLDRSGQNSSSIASNSKVVDTGGGEFVTLYRAVKPAELEQISNEGVFKNVAGITAEGKYFSTSLDEVVRYAEMAQKRFGDPPYSFVKTRFPKQNVTEVMKADVDGGIPSFVIPEAEFHHLSQPEIININQLMQRKLK